MLHLDRTHEPRKTADIINIQNVTTDDSFAKVIEIGSGITEIQIEK